MGDKGREVEGHRAAIGAEEIRAPGKQFGRVPGNCRSEAAPDPIALDCPTRVATNGVGHPRRVIGAVEKVSQR